MRGPDVKREKKVVATQKRPDSGQPELAPAPPASSVTFTIGELSRVTGVRPSTLRDWELHGIVVPHRTGSHRRYTTTDVARVRAARQLRSRNFNPSAIAAVLGNLEPSPVESQAPVNVGSTLREARKIACLTLLEVSRQVGCSVSHLSGIERGASVPSMALLHRIAAQYGIDVATVFGGVSSNGPVRTRAEGSAPYVSDGGTLKVWGVARTTSICADIYEAEPGGGSKGCYSHEGEEYVLVLSGEMQITLEGYPPYLLQAGDALSFSSTIPHEWRNASCERVRLLWTNAHPETVASRQPSLRRTVERADMFESAAIVKGASSSR